MMSSFARILRGSLEKNHEFKKISSKISKKALERSLEITWSHSQRNLDSAIDNEAASVVDGKKIISPESYEVSLVSLIFIDFGDIFWLETIDFWTDSLQNHDYIGNFDWTQLCDHSVKFYVLIRDRY